MKKIILVVIDGLGDRPISQLGNKTPLEAAKTPNLDFLARDGIGGLVLPWVKEGKLPTSEDTHLALLGFDPKKFNPGRGTLEVLGMGVKILPGDVCLRGNFATVNPKNLKIIHRRAGRIEKTEGLIGAISGIEVEGIKFLIKKGVSHRVGVIIRGKGLSPKISDSDPKLTGVQSLQVRPLDKSKEAGFTARILNQFLAKAHLILKDHPENKKRKLPANCILVRGAGKYKKIESFQKKYKIKASCIAGGTLYKGIAEFLGMELIKVKGANALPTTNLRGKFQAAKEALKKNDFLFLHVKAADNLAEDGDFLGKKEFIEKIDKNLKPLLKLKNTLIVITADHSTCSNLKRHCLEPIPILICGDGRDSIERFSKKTCQKGKIGRIKQMNLMAKILRYAR